MCLIPGPSLKSCLIIDNTQLGLRACSFLRWKLQILMILQVVGIVEGLACAYSLLSTRVGALCRTWEQALVMQMHFKRAHASEQFKAEGSCVCRLL